MKYSYLLLFCGLSQLLLFVTANPPNPCTDPSNYNLVVPMRRTTSNYANVALSTDTYLTNGCYTLQIFSYGLSVSQSTQTDTTPYASVYFNARLSDTCTGSSVYLYAYEYFYYQTFLTVSNNLNHASVAGLFASGTFFTNEGPVGFSVTTTPVSFEGHSPAQYKSNGRSVNRIGSQCRIDYQNSNVSNNDASTNSFTLSLTLDGNPNQIDFVVPSNVNASVGTSTGSNTYHQCTCNGL